MGTLIDTGVLLRAFDSKSAHYRPIRQALRKLLDDGEALTVTVQNMAESWNVATRPLEHNGQVLSVERVKRRIAIIERLCDVIARRRLVRALETHSGVAWRQWREGPRRETNLGDAPFRPETNPHFE
jgi:predicted nucleic acid-binding protein